jgi:RNA polymerase sporulation-specific sigma factor
VTDADVRRWEGLIVKMAKEFYLPGSEWDDLIQEGRIGLMQAFRDYIPETGVPFAAFVMLCVRRQMLTALKTALRAKHRPLTQSARFSAPMPDGTPLGDALPHPITETYRIVEARDALDRILSMQLSDREALALQHMIAGSTYDEAAADMGCTVKSVDNAMQRVKRRALQVAA